MLLKLSIYLFICPHSRKSLNIPMSASFVTCRMISMSVTVPSYNCMYL